MHTVCNDVAMPVEPEKDEGPATTISFLGLELDSVALEVRLTPRKPQEPKGSTEELEGKEGTQEERLALINGLPHAMHAVQSGQDGAIYGGCLCS